MSAWKEWMQNAVAFLKYKAGWDAGYTQGEKAGQYEAAMFITLMKQYGSIEGIPTNLILEAMPGRGPIVIKQQAIKLATLHLRDFCTSMDLPIITETIEIVIKYLENDMASMTPDEALEIDLITESPSYFSSLIFLAAKVDGLNIEELLERLHRPGNTKALDLYYRCMKNEYFVVR